MSHLFWNSESESSSGSDDERPNKKNEARAPTKKVEKDADENNDYEAEDDDNNDQEEVAAESFSAKNQLGQTSKQQREVQEHEKKVQYLDDVVSRKSILHQEDPRRIPEKYTQASNSVNNVNFEIMSDQEIRKMSVCQLVSHVTWEIPDQSLFRGGIHDSRMGPATSTPKVWSKCDTCFMFDECPGHMGHFELAVPVFRPMVFKYLGMLLNSICASCGKFYPSVKTKKQVIARFKCHDRQRTAPVALKSLKEAETPEEDLPILEELEKILRAPWLVDFHKTTAVHYIDRQEMAENVFKFSKDPARLGHTGRMEKCLHCEVKRTPWLCSLKKQTPTSVDYLLVKNNKRVSPAEVRELLSKTWQSPLDLQMLTALFGPVRNNVRIVPNMDAFVFQVLPIPSNISRPLMAASAEKKNKNSSSWALNRMSHLITTIIKCDAEIRKSSLDAPQALPRLIKALQDHINNLYLGEGSYHSRLDKKTGVMRAHIQGKRVNHTARSVVNPDPYLDTNEVMFSVDFAKNLAFPTHVNDLNYKEMKTLIFNGPQKYPGALWIKTSTQMISLKGLSEEKRRVLAARLIRGTSGSEQPVIVGRHARNGDMCIVNRQPTLHKYGLVGLRLRVTQRPEKVIRMHYSNCAGFNADFDGDEINVHLVQDFQAQSELAQILDSDRNYVSIRSSEPLRGLIQDHVIGGIQLTKKDTFFTKGDFQQLVFSAISTKTHVPLKMPIPAILKPRPLWTGKQIISAILAHIARGMEPLNVTGNTRVSAKMWVGHPDEAKVIIRNNELVQGVLERSQYGPSSYGLVHTVEEFYSPKHAGELLTTLGRLLTLYVQRIGHTCGLDDMMLTPEANAFRNNELKNLTEMGYSLSEQYLGLETKVKNPREREAFYRRNIEEKYRLNPVFERTKLDQLFTRNLAQMSTRIIEHSLPGGQVKQFPENTMALMTGSGAKGSTVNFSQISCLLGQQELEGKRPPLMCSGKTLPTFLPFDSHPRASGFVGDRFLTGLRPPEFFFHTMAGREGLIDTAVKTAKSGHLERSVIKHLESLTVQYDRTVRSPDGMVIQFYYGEDALDPSLTSTFKNLELIANNYKALAHLTNVEGDTKSVQKWRKKKTKVVETAMSRFSPDRFLGATSESFHKSVEDFIKARPDLFEGSSRVVPSSDAFRQLMNTYYRKCMIEPGTPVGILAAHSMGEPATQMTLNTFHLAGRGDVNVTLGVPRLNELIRFANASTPTFAFCTRPGVSQDAAQKLLAHITPHSFKDELESFHISESAKFEDQQVVYSYLLTLQLKTLECPQHIAHFRTDLAKLVLMINNGKRGSLRSYVTKITAVRKSVPPIDESAPTSAAGNTSENSNHNKDEDDLMDLDAQDEDKDEENEEEEEGDDLIDEDDSSPAKGKLARGPAADEDWSPSRCIAQGALTSWQQNGPEIQIAFDIQRRVNITEVIELLASECHLFRIPGIMQTWLDQDETRPEKPWRLNLTRDKRFMDIVPFNHFCIDHRDLLDGSTLYINSPVIMATHFGLEVGRNVLINEISTIFKIYGIKVQHSHLSLLADYMSHTGKIRGCSGTTGLKIQADPIGRSSNEQCTNNLVSGALQGEIDTLCDTASRVALGTNIGTGTGFFDILSRIDLKF